MSFLKSMKAWFSELSDGNGTAVHVESNDGHHAICMKSLRVVLIQDGDKSWFAQSLDIDYASSGATMADAQANFEQGLSATIKAHLETFGNIDRLMKSPDLGDLHIPQGPQFGFSMTTAHRISDSYISNLPYENIEYGMAA